MDKTDSSGMYKIYDRWPSMAREAYDSDLESIHFENIDHIIFAGMGGSGAIGDLFSSILSKNNIHVNVIKGYVLPKTVNKNTLVVCTSVSGNTVETLSIMESASNLDCKVIGFSSGGKMERFCIDNNIPFRKIPMIHSPRASFVTFVYSMLNVLESIIPIVKKDIKESFTTIETLSTKINSSNIEETNPALSLAEFLNDIPCIYYPSGLYAAAIRFKNSLQENAKMHAFTEDIIEASHNGIVSWEISSNVRPVFLRGTEDHPKTKERWNILKEYFQENKIPFKEILSVEGNILSKIISLNYLLDYCSLYRAILSNMDPSPVKSIDFIKSRLD